MLNLPKDVISLEIERLVSVLKETPPESKEYESISQNVKCLCESRGVKSAGVDANTVVMAVTNILGILLVLNYEQLSIVTSKAFNIIPKGRL